MPPRGSSLRCTEAPATEASALSSVYNSTGATGSFVGLPLRPQSGWGGGPNVTFGPPSANYGACPVVFHDAFPFS